MHDMGGLPPKADFDLAPPDSKVDIVATVPMCCLRELIVVDHASDAI
jgi:hypothetical protein